MGGQNCQEKERFGAREGTRTPILFRGLAPKASASTNFATLAMGFYRGEKSTLGWSTNFLKNEEGWPGMYFINLSACPPLRQAQDKLRHEPCDGRRVWPAIRSYEPCEERRMVGRQGLEPWTCRLRVCCSTSWASNPHACFYAHKSSRMKRKIKKWMREFQNYQVN